MGKELSSEPIRLAEYRRNNFTRRHTARRSGSHHVSFSRQELRSLLEIYSQRVMTGEWRDYAIDHRSGRAVFSVFRHSFDRPFFVITKQNNSGQCDFRVHSGPEQLKRSGSLEEVLSVFTRRLRAVSSNGIFRF